MSSITQHLGALTAIRDDNFDVLAMISQYLQTDPRFITADLVNTLVSDCHVPPEAAWYMLFLGACDLDIDAFPRHRRLADTYLQPAIRCLSAADYRNNPYYQNIVIPATKRGDWDLRTKTLAPFEACIYNDIIVTPALREIPRLGYFDTPFSYPAVLEGGNEWMTLMPNETATTDPAVAQVHGQVVTFGLGLGYFAYMASCKPEVSRMVVVEKSADVIALFKAVILPQFPHPEKVTIVHADAVDYAKTILPTETFDYAFVDIWRDAGDGVDWYLTFNKLEDESPHTQFLYWVEDTLLSTLRWQIFDQLCDCADHPKDYPFPKDYDNLEAALSNAGVKQRAKTMFSL